VFAGDVGREARRAKASATVLPVPELAPVTSATRPDDVVGMRDDLLIMTSWRSRSGWC
jgi:hypothetical protein